MKYRYLGRTVTASALATAAAITVAAPAFAYPEATASSPSTGQIVASIHNTMDWAIDCDVSITQGQQLPNIPIAVLQDIQPGDTKSIGPVGTPLKTGHAYVGFTCKARNGWNIRLNVDVDVP